MHGGTIGVLGGMGPAATHFFFGRLIHKSDAATDQAHERVVIDSNPHIPDRTAFIAGEGEDPRPALTDTARNVERAGADLLTIPCNSAHAFFDAISQSVDIPVLNMIDGAIGALEARSDVTRVGLLATDGTREMELYQRAAEGTGIEIVLPSSDDQQRVMDAIYGPTGIKAGYRTEPNELLVEVVDRLGDVDAVIAGCTEVPLALSSDDSPVVLIDPMEVLAEDALRMANSMAD